MAITQSTEVTKTGRLLPVNFMHFALNSPFSLLKLRVKNLRAISIFDAIRMQPMQGKGKSSPYTETPL